MKNTVFAYRIQNSGALYVSARYELCAPLNVKANVPHPITEKHFLIKFFIANPDGGKTVYPDTLKYR